MSSYKTLVLPTATVEERDITVQQIMKFHQAREAAGQPYADNKVDLADGRILRIYSDCPVHGPVAKSWDIDKPLATGWWGDKIIPMGTFSIAPQTTEQSDGMGGGVSLSGLTLLGIWRRRYQWPFERVQLQNKIDSCAGDIAAQLYWAQIASGSGIIAHSGLPFLERTPSGHLPHRPLAIWTHAFNTAQTADEATQTADRAAQMKSVLESITKSFGRRVLMTPVVIGEDPLWEKKLVEFGFAPHPQFSEPTSIRQNGAKFYMQLLRRPADPAISDAEKTAARLVIEHLY